MEYYAGLFDAEGCASLTPGGSIKVRLNNTNELVPNLFKEKFGGTVYKETKRKTKPIYSWYLNSENFNFFCENIIPNSFTKRSQLEILFNYRNSSRLNRRENRKNIVSSISALKKPIIVDRDFFHSPGSIEATESFYKWLAGFIEGDGSIRLHENSTNPCVFSTQIGACNTFPDPIKMIYQRIPGSITSTKPYPPMWKWVCYEGFVKLFLTKTFPFLVVKKQQAALIFDFLQIKESKHRNDKYTHEQVNNIRDLVSKIKHLNSF